MENEHAYEHPWFLPAFLVPVGNSLLDLPKYNKYISDHLLYIYLGLVKRMGNSCIASI